MRRLPALFTALLLVLFWMSNAVRAQDTPPLFATNTPLAPSAPITQPRPTAQPFILATNTPATPSVANVLPTAIPLATGPSAPVEQFALREWDETQLANAVIAQIGRIQAGDSDSLRAAQLVFAQFLQHFPSAPTDLNLRRELLAAALDSAPAGAFDLRSVVRPFIVAALNQQRPPLDTPNALAANGFEVTLTPINLNRDELADALVETRYPADAAPDALRYHDYTFVQVNAQGIYSILPGDYPAAPMGEQTDITLERLGDLNGDGAHDMALSVADADVNRQLFIYAYRNNAAINLIEPGQQARFLSVTTWPDGGGDVLLSEARVESEAWGCLGERQTKWAWRGNFYRPAETGTYSFQGRLACLLFGAEPYFDHAPVEAISTIENVLAQTQGVLTDADKPAEQRAQLLLAQLHLLSHDPSPALDIINNLDAQAAPDSWLKAETSAFLTKAGESNVLPLDMCVVLQYAVPNGACDIDQALAYHFSEQPLSRSASLESQLAQRGLTILESTALVEIGKVAREAFRFNFPGDHWWAFAPLAKDSYTAEMIDPPAGRESVSTTLLTALDVPAAAYRLLLSADDCPAALVMLDSAARLNPAVPPTLSWRFLHNYCYDRLSQRENARLGYYALWADAPDSLWGQLSAMYLEKRG